MSDDIVTRLRLYKDLSTVPCAEAADEIERLRADRDGWRKVADNVAFIRLLVDNLCQCDVCDVVRRAVRGE